MNTLPYPVVEKVISQLEERDIQLCEQTFEDSIEMILKRIFAEEVSGKDVQELRYQLFNSQFQRTKKRWFASLLKSLELTTKKKTELAKEMEHAQSLYEEFGKDKFQLLYEVNDIEELRHLRLHEIEDWSKNEEKKLIDYCYIREKTKTQIIKAITIDLSLILVTIGINHLNGNFDNYFLEITDTMEENAIFSVSRGKIKFSPKPILIEGEEYYVNEYTPTKDYSLMTLVGRNAIEEGEYRKDVLDETDEMIYHAVMSYRDVEFVSNRRIYVDVNEIMKQLYNSKSGRLLDMIEQRIRKMSYLKFTATSKEQAKDYIIYGIFDFVRRRAGESGGRTLEITVNDIFHQELIGKQVTRIYKDVLTKLENRLAKTLIFSLQKERLRKHLEGSNEGIFSYEFFLFRMRFRKKNKKDNYELIEACLKELQENEISILNYTRIGSHFHVTFIPVISHEINDLLPLTKNNSPLNIE